MLGGESRRQPLGDPGDPGLGSLSEAASPSAERAQCLSHIAVVKSKYVKPAGHCLAHDYEEHEAMALYEKALEIRLPYVKDNKKL